MLSFVTCVLLTLKPSFHIACQCVTKKVGLFASLSGSTTFRYLVCRLGVYFGLFHQGIGFLYENSSSASQNLRASCSNSVAEKCATFSTLGAAG